MDTYSAIVNSVADVQDPNHMQMLVSFTPKIINFLGSMAQDNEIDTFVQIAGLLGDLAGCCGKMIS